MRHRILLVINGSVVLFVLTLLIAHFTSTPGTAQESFVQPSPAATIPFATHLTYVVFEEDASGQVMTAVVAQPLDRKSQVVEIGSSQAEPVMCMTDT